MERRQLKLGFQKNREETFIKRKKKKVQTVVSYREKGVCTRERYTQFFRYSTYMNVNKFM
jgi:hypothetical protein